MIFITYSVYDDGDHESIIDDPIINVSAFVKTQESTLECREDWHKTSARVFARVLNT